MSTVPRERNETDLIEIITDPTNEKSSEIRWETRGCARKAARGTRVCYLIKPDLVVSVRHRPELMGRDRSSEVLFGAP